MKKALAYLLAIMLLTLILETCAAEAASEWKYDTLWGYLNGYSGSGGDVAVPAEVDGNAVRIIQSKGLSNREDIVSFTVPEGVTALGEHVMSGVKSLTAVKLPQTLQMIGDFCFYHCESLADVTVPASVRYIGNDAFGWCSNLKTITFEGPCPVLKRGDTFLDWMPGVTVYVPDDQLEAYRAAMTAAGSGQIQPSGRNALPQTELSAEYTVDPETGTLVRCSSQDIWIIVPAEIDGVQIRTIGADAFRKNDFCYGILLPEGLEKIEPEAFSGLSRLAYAPIPTTVRDIGEEAYAHYNGYHLTLPEGLTEISRRAFYGSALEGELTVPAGVTRIGEEAFAGTNLSAINLPSSLVSIGTKGIGRYVSEIYLEALALPEMTGDSFEDPDRETTVILPPAAGEAEVAAAQALLDSLGEGFTVVRLEEPNGIYPESPYSRPAVTEAPVPEVTEPPAETVSEAPAETPAAAPATGTEAPVNFPDLGGYSLPEGVSLNPKDYEGTWYSIYYGTGGFTGDPRIAMDHQDVMVLNPDGSIETNLGDSFTHWGIDPEDGWIRAGDVGIILLPGGFLQFNNRISGYTIMSRDKDAVWDPETPMFEDLMEATLVAQPTPEPTAPPAVRVTGEKPEAGDGSIALETKYTCVRYMAAGYEMDASLLGAELSVVLHADGSMDFIMLGAEVAGLTWSWDGSEAVADYYGAGELRFTPGDEGTVALDFMGTMTYILETIPE